MTIMSHQIKIINKDRKLQKKKNKVKNLELKITITEMKKKF